MDEFVRLCRLDDQIRREAPAPLPQPAKEGVLARGLGLATKAQIKRGGGGIWIRHRNVIIELPGDRLGKLAEVARSSGLPRGWTHKDRRDI